MRKLSMVFLALLLSLGPGLAAATDDEFAAEIFLGLEAANEEVTKEAPKETPKETSKAIDFHKLYKMAGTLGHDMAMPVLLVIIPILAVICASIISVKSNNNATRSAIKIAQESKQALLDQEQWRRVRYVMDKKLSLASEIMTLCSLDGISFNHSDKADKRKALDAFNERRKSLVFNNFQLATLGTGKQEATASKISSLMTDISSRIYQLYPDLIDAKTPEDHDVIWSQFTSVLLDGHKKLVDLAFELKGTVREEFTLFQQQTESGGK